MSKEFEELTLDGSNYPTWATDIKIAFASRGILTTINEYLENAPQITDQFKYTALLLLRVSIHTDLYKEYRLEENPHTLWVLLKERYEQQKEIIFLMILCNQYHKKRHTVYSQLIHSLSKADIQFIHNLFTHYLKQKRIINFFLKNHHLRPVGSASLPCVHNVMNKSVNTRKFYGNSSETPKNSTGRRSNSNRSHKHKANKRAR
ncbi:hypothetical protein BS78_03G125900 [Paspalum vaginatum]|nr:hypothetical protein BS78_03G125900 [Paspalum vaginatum]